MRKHNENVTSVGSLDKVRLSVFTIFHRLWRHSAHAMGTSAGFSTLFCIWEGAATTTEITTSCCTVRMFSANIQRSNGTTLDVIMMSVIDVVETLGFGYSNLRALLKLGNNSFELSDGAHLLRPRAFPGTYAAAGVWCHRLHRLVRHMKREDD